jgi:hypothetical protein
MVHNFLNDYIEVAYLNGQLSLVTFYCYYVARVYSRRSGLLYTINEPTGSFNQQLSNKIMTPQNSITVVKKPRM